MSPHNVLCNVLGGSEDIEWRQILTTLELGYLKLTKQILSRYIQKLLHEIL